MSKIVLPNGTEAEIKEGRWDSTDKFLLTYLKIRFPVNDSPSNPGNWQELDEAARILKGRVEYDEPEPSEAGVVY